MKRWRIREELKKIREFVQNPESTNVVIAVATVVIAVATVYTYSEIHSGSTQTDKIIAADQRIATAMEKAVGQAGVALNASVDASRTDQRAWVADVAITGVPTIGQKWIVSIKCKNTGKTFAKEFRMRTAVYKAMPPRTQPDFTQGTEVPYGSISVLAPNAEYISNTTVTGDAISGHPLANPTQADLDLIESGAITLFAYGKMEYSDIFRKHHWTSFCFHLSRKIEWESCPVHNDTDSN